MNVSTTIEPMGPNALAGATQAPSLSERTMLVTLNISQWTARRQDRKATDRFISDNHAQRGAGRFNKCMVDPDALQPLQKVVGAARQEHAELTLPWLNDGTRILPADAFFVWSQKMQKHREAFEREVADFLAKYPRLVGEAQRHLGDLFDSSEYPEPGAIERRFSWQTEIFPLPDSSDFRVELGDANVQAIREKIEESTQRAMQQAMGETWTRLHAAVSRMVERLNAYKPGKDGGRATGVFRDSLVENVRELVEVLPLLNIAGDPRLAEMVERARIDLCHYDADALRESDEARQEVAQAAQSIVDDLAGFMGGEG